MRRTFHRPGFTLIEMAVVMIIIGIIAALTIPIVGEKLKQDKISKSRGTLNSLKQEIIGYAQTHRALPGELAVESSFANARDAQQNYIAYYADPSLKTGDICTQSSTNYALTIGATTYSNLAFILASRGANQNLQIDAGAIDAATRTVTTYTQGTLHDNFNSAPVSGLTQTYDIAGDNDNIEFDDIVDYVTLDALKGKACEASTGVTGAAVGMENAAQEWAKGATNAATSGGLSSNAVLTDPVSQELQFGNGVDGMWACLWWNGTYTNYPGTTPEAFNDRLECPSVSSTSYCRAYDYPTITGGTDRWNRLVAAFKFTVLNSDKTVASNTYHGGIVFTLVGADNNDDGSVTLADANMGPLPPCGRAMTTGGFTDDSLLGYAGAGDGVNSNLTGIAPPKIGIEIDFYPHDTGAENRNDPGPNHADWGTPPCTGIPSSFADHIAVVYFNDGGTSGHNNDNQHGYDGGAGNVVNPPYANEYAGDTTCRTLSTTPSAFDGFATNATAYTDGDPDRAEQWLEDGDEHWVRVQIERGMSAEVGGAHNGRYKYVVHIWLDDTPNATFLNLNLESGGQMTKGALSGADHYEQSTVYLSPSDHRKFHAFRLGWTTAQASDPNSSQTTNVAGFGMNATSCDSGNGPTRPCSAFTP